MATTTQRKPRVKVKPERRVRVSCANAMGVRLLTMTIKTGEKVETDDYLLAPIPGAQGGNAFQVTKVESEGRGNSYHVQIAGEASTCECKGFLRWHHCRHVESLQALTAAGRLSA